jgi:hypothetical protein
VSSKEVKNKVGGLWSTDPKSWRTRGSSEAAYPMKMKNTSNNTNQTAFQR